MKLTSIRRGMLACVGAAWLAAAPLHAVAGGPAGKPERMADSPLSKPEFTDRLVVKYRNAVRASAADAGLMGAARTVAARRNLGLQQVRRTAQGAQVLQLNRRISLREAYALAQEIQAQDASVQYAEPDRRVHALFTPNDPLFNDQWQYHEPAGINAPAAWNKSTGRGVVVAVIDTGYRPHADLVANIVPGYDFLGVPEEGRDGDGRDANAMDEGDYLTAADCGLGGSADEIRAPSSFHGTHVAGTVAAVAHNGIGVSGTAFNAKVQPLRVLGPCGGLMSDVADAIVWASGGMVAGLPPNPTPARVINMSLGGEGQCPQTVQNAIDEARGRGTVVVASAGNSALPASTSAPANCGGVIAVAAVGRTGARASYSNFGYGVTVAAPGGDGANGILSTLNDGITKPGADNYVSYQGTSMAAPHVAGVVALMLSVNPSLTPDQVAAELKASARPGGTKCRLCGAGLLDADAAVTAAMGPPPAEPPPAIPLTEAEPNNTRATAQKSTIRHGIVTGSLSSAADNDYYAVTVAPGRYLAVLLKPAPTADLDLYVYDSAGALIGKSIQGGFGFTDQAYVGNYSNADATMYLRVVFYKAAPGADAAPKSYTLEWAPE